MGGGGERGKREGACLRVVLRGDERRRHHGDCVGIPRSYLHVLGALLVWEAILLTLAACQ